MHEALDIYDQVSSGARVVFWVCAWSDALVCRAHRLSCTHECGCRPAFQVCGRVLTAPNMLDARAAAFHGAQELPSPVPWQLFRKACFCGRLWSEGARCCLQLCGLVLPRLLSKMRALLLPGRARGLIPGRHGSRTWRAVRVQSLLA